MITRQRRRHCVLRTARGRARHEVTIYRVTHERTAGAEHISVLGALAQYYTHSVRCLLHSIRSFVGLASVRQPISCCRSSTFRFGAISRHIAAAVASVVRNASISGWLCAAFNYYINNTLQHTSARLQRGPRSPCRTRIAHSIPTTRHVLLSSCCRRVAGCCYVYHTVLLGAHFTHTQRRVCVESM